MNCTKNKIIFFAALLLVLPLSVIAQDFNRTIMQVERLSCSSCLSHIETELKKIPGMIGMRADLQTGQLMADHYSIVTGEQLADVISQLGYPARVAGEDVVSDREALFFDNGIFTRCGSGGCNSSGCSATASAWKELYHRIFNTSP